MRIGVDGLLLWGQPSGVEKAIAHLLYALAARGDDEYLVYLPADGKLEPAPGTRVHVRRMPFVGRRRSLRILWQQAVLPHRLRRDRVDVLLAPGYTLPLRWQGPSVLAVYDVIALTHPELARRSNVWHYRWALPLSVCRASRIVVPSRHVREQLVSHVAADPSRVAVVPLGVDAAFRRPPQPDLDRVRAAYQLPERFLLHVGNAEPKKNLPRLVEAYSLLGEWRRSHRLVLAGKPAWGEAALQAAIERTGVNRQVVQTGYVPDRDLPALYALACLLVFPSLAEGFGLPPLEAMACGTPALVSDGPPFDETVGDAAVRVNPLSAEAIAHGIRRVLEDESLRRELRDRGLERASRFTWERTARDVRALLEEVA